MVATPLQALDAKNVKAIQNTFHTRKLPLHPIGFYRVNPCGCKRHTCELLDPKNPKLDRDPIGRVQDDSYEGHQLMPSRTPIVLQNRALLGKHPFHINPANRRRDYTMPLQPVSTTGNVGLHFFLICSNIRDLVSPGAHCNLNIRDGPTRLTLFRLLIYSNGIHQLVGSNQKKPPFYQSKSEDRGKIFGMSLSDCYSPDSF